MLKKKSDTDEVVIYNFNIQKQDIDFLYRGDSVPPHLKEYKRLWRLYDRQQKKETIIISI